MLRTYWKAKEAGVRLIGPNCPGVLSPGKANVGIIPAQFFDPGTIGVVSKSGTLTYQIGNELKQAGDGQLLDRRHRRRPDRRLRLHRHPHALRGRPRDRADRDGRRDRRRRRGAGRRVHRRRGLKAGRRLHRRLHRAARQADGPRRRDHLRLLRAPPRRRRRRSRRRASGSAKARPRRPRSPSRRCGRWAATLRKPPPGLQLLATSRVSEVSADDRL